MPNTPTYGFPYPAYTDPPDGSFNTEALALAAEAEIARVNADTTLIWRGAVLFIFKTSNQALATHTWTEIAMAGETIDTDGYHSTVTSTARITPTVMGTYRVRANASFAANAVGERRVCIGKNGQPQPPLNRNVNPSSGVALDLATERLVQITIPGDYISMFMYQSSGGNLNALGNNTSDSLDKCSISCELVRVA